LQHCQYATERLKKVVDKGLNPVVDIWTMKTGYSIFGTTAQYIHDWTMIKVVLGFEVISGSQTAENVKAHLNNVLANYKVDEKKVCLCC